MRAWRACSNAGRAAWWRRRSAVSGTSGLAVANSGRLQPGAATTRAAAQGAPLACATPQAASGAPSLTRYLQQHGLEPELLLAADEALPAQPAAAALGSAGEECAANGVVGLAAAGGKGGGSVSTLQGACRVKSLVFLADGAPVVAVLALGQRVDRRLLAAALGVRPNALRLAPQDQLQRLCGYPVGSVPPLGHEPRLPVIVDRGLLQHSHCLVGSGEEGGLLCLPLPDVLRLAEARVADIVATATSSSGSRSSSMDSFDVSCSSELDPNGSPLMVGEPAAAATLDERATQQMLGDRAAAALQALPLPWEAGSQVVTLEGLVAQKRKIARLLCFANLVPLPAAGGLVPLIQPGSGTYLRRLWRCPEGGGACEVQLIVGKTLAERLGREEAAEVIRGLRVGQCVRIVGRPQPHASPPHGTRRSDVLDVVVQELQLLPQPELPVASAGVESSAAAPAALAAPAEPSPAAAALANSRATGSAAGQRPFLHIPPEVPVEMVDSLEGLSRLEQALFGPAAADAGAGTNASIAAIRLDDSPAAAASSAADSSSLSAPGRAVDAMPISRVVGLDCEWQPYERGAPHTPVALLQLAVQRWPGSPRGRLEGIECEAHQGQQQVFLLDLLALCRSPGVAAAAAGGAGSSGTSEDPGPGSQPMQAGEQQQQQAGELTSEERLLNDLLQRLFEGADVIKVGFKLSHDLSRLVESYPHLPCFGSQGPVPFRSHVDISLLAQATLPHGLGRGRAGAARRRREAMGLSALAGEVLGWHIDKSQQVSDWAHRPLSAAQQAYAATDAFAVVALFEELLRSQHAPHAPQAVQQHHTLQPLTPAWLAHMAAGLTHVPTSELEAKTHRKSHTRLHDKRRALTASPLATSSQHTAGGSTELRPSSGISSTLRMLCNVEHLLGRYLGRELPEGGKPPAVRAGAADGTGCEPQRLPSFPRGSGVLEWRNAFMLFVNLPPAAGGGHGDGGGRRAARYNNQFLWGEVAQPAGQLEGQQEGHEQMQDHQHQYLGQQLYMTWWPGRGQTPEHPVIRRMLRQQHPGSKAASAATAQQEQAPAVLLFCRPAGRPYVVCGRLRQAPPTACAQPGESSSSSGSIIWQLLDWPALQKSPAFMELLAAQQQV